MMTISTIQELVEKQAISLDIGCGPNKQAGFIGMDIRPLDGVDIVHDIEKFPYPLPDECCTLVMASHLMEHINPHAGDNRTTNLIRLLLDKNLITPQDVKDYIGEIDPGPIFMRLMDEIWRILRVGGRFMMEFPYAGTPPFWQDPTHVNGITEVTLAYFDPEEPNTRGGLYHIYEPRPWKIVYHTNNNAGIMNVVLEKRADDPKYHRNTGQVGFRNEE